MDGISSSAAMQPRELMRQSEARITDPRALQAPTRPDAPASPAASEPASAVVTLSDAARSQASRPAQADQNTPEARAAAAVQGAPAEDGQVSYTAQRAVEAYRDVEQAAVARDAATPPGQQAPSLLRG